MSKKIDFVRVAFRFWWYKWLLLFCCKKV